MTQEEEMKIIEEIRENTIKNADYFMVTRFKKFLTSLLTIQTKTQKKRQYHILTMHLNTIGDVVIPKI